MEITKFPNKEAAIEAITEEDKECVFVRHKLKRCQTVKLHYHNKANEWVVIDNGKFQVKLGEEKKTLNLQHQTIVIHFPVNQKHALWAISEISYLVFRDKKDKTIYCE